MFAAGKTQGEIAEALGVHRTTISRRLRSAYQPTTTRPSPEVEAAAAQLKPVRRPKKTGGRRPKE